MPKSDAFTKLNPVKQPKKPSETPHGQRRNPGGRKKINRTGSSVMKRVQCIGQLHFNFSGAAKAASQHMEVG